MRARESGGDALAGSAVALKGVDLMERVLLTIGAFRLYDLIFFMISTVAYSTIFSFFRIIQTEAIPTCFTYV